MIYVCREQDYFLRQNRSRPASRPIAFHGYGSSDLPCRASNARSRTRPGRIARGGELEALLDELRALEKQREELLIGLNRRERVHGQRPDRDALEAAVRRRVDNWRGLLMRRTTHGRQLLRELLKGRSGFDPQPNRTYRFQGEASFGSALTSEVFNECGTGTGIRTPVPWLRTTCPDP
jgi:hypothetical protein